MPTNIFFDCYIKINDIVLTKFDIEKYTLIDKNLDHTQIFNSLIVRFKIDNSIICNTPINQLISFYFGTEYLVKFFVETKEIKGEYIELKLKNIFSTLRDKYFCVKTFYGAVKLNEHIKNNPENTNLTVNTLIKYIVSIAQNSEFTGAVIEKNRLEIIDDEGSNFDDILNVYTFNSNIKDWAVIKNDSTGFEQITCFEILHTLQEIFSFNLYFNQENNIIINSYKSILVNKQSYLKNGTNEEINKLYLNDNNNEKIENIKNINPLFFLDITTFLDKSNESIKKINMREITGINNNTEINYFRYTQKTVNNTEKKELPKNFDLKSYISLNDNRYYFPSPLKINTYGYLEKGVYNTYKRLFFNADYNGYLYKLLDSYSIDEKVLLTTKITGEDLYNSFYNVKKVVIDFKKLTVETTILQPNFKKEN